MQSRWIRLNGRAAVAVIVAAAICAGTVVTFGVDRSSAGSRRALVPSSRSGSSVACKHFTSVKMQEWPGDIINIVPQVALATGMFKAHCLEASFVPIDTGPGALTAALAGSIDFVNTAMNVSMVARARGIKVAVVANMYKYQPWALVARKGLALPNARQGYPAVMRDLIGKTIGVTTLGGSAEAFARANFQSAGINPNRATYVAVGPTPAEIAALKAGRVDAIEMFGLGPDVAQALGAGRIIVNMRKPGVGPKSIQATDGAALSWVAVKEFTEANNEAIHWIQTLANRSRLYKIIAARVKLPAGIKDPTATLHAIVDANAASLGAGVPRKAVAGWNALLIKSGLLTKAIPYSQAVWMPTAGMS